MDLLLPSLLIASHITSFTCINVMTSVRLTRYKKKSSGFLFSLQNIKPQSKHGVIYDVDVAKKNKTEAGNKN